MPVLSGSFAEPSYETIELSGKSNKSKSIKQFRVIETFIGIYLSAIGTYE